jgi:uncharacterized protein (DUF4415 family)
MKQKKMPDPDKPLTEAEFKRMKKVYGFDGLASIIGEENVAPLRLRAKLTQEKSTQENKKVSLRLLVDFDIADKFRKTGRGWQTRMNALLRNAVEQGLV